VICFDPLIGAQNSAPIFVSDVDNEYIEMKEVQFIFGLFSQPRDLLRLQPRRREGVSVGLYVPSVGPPVQRM